METKKTKLSGKAMLQFIVLCAGATTIYLPVFAKSSFYDAFVEGFGITNAQFGTLFSVYTLLTLLTYFLGGIVADKFSPRKLLTLSFLATGLLAIWQSTFPSYNVALFIYGAMGVTTTLTFWAALIKATRQFGQTMGGESKALGSLEGGRGLASIVISTLCAFVFATFIQMSMGLRVVLLIYAGILIVVGILSWFVFNDEAAEKEAVAQESTLKLIGICLRNPMVWVVSLMVLGAYAMTSTMGGYVSKMGTTSFGMTVQLAAFIPVISSYLRPLGSFGGGWLGDKVGASKTMIIGTIGLIIPALIIVLLPTGKSMG
ncbi:MAG: MFS transporter, partial [Eubacterium sp.]